MHKAVEKGGEGASLVSQPFFIGGRRKRESGKLQCNILQWHSAQEVPIRINCGNCMAANLL